jgi:hypothetical protein
MCLCPPAVPVKYEREWIHAAAQTGWKDLEGRPRTTLRGSARAPSRGGSCGQEARTVPQRSASFRVVDSLSLGRATALVGEARAHIHAGHPEHDLAGLENGYAGSVAVESHDRLSALEAKSEPKAVHGESP